MANIKIVSWEVRPEKFVKMVVHVFADGVDVPAKSEDNAGELAHFEVLLPEPEVRAAFELAPVERNKVMMAMVKADERIQGIIASERVAKLLNATYTPPFVVAI